MQPAAKHSANITQFYTLFPTLKLRGFHKSVLKLWSYFPFLHHVVIKRHNVLQVGTGSTFRVKEMVDADAAAMWWKKMCLLYRKI